MNDDVYLRAVDKTVNFDAVFTQKDFPVLTSLRDVIQGFSFPRGMIMNLDYHTDSLDLEVVEELCYQPVFQGRSYLTGAAFRASEEGLVAIIIPTKADEGEEQYDTLLLTRGTLPREIIEEMLGRLATVYSLSSGENTSRSLDSHGRINI